MMLSLALIIGSFFVTIFLTTAVKKSLIQRDLLDRPNERSSHTAPVPRGGGWAIVAVLAATMLLAMVMVPDSSSLHARLLAGLFLLVFVSWFDDKRHVSARIRLAAHVAAAAMAVSGLPAEATVFGGHLPLLLDRALTVLGWAWFMNLYNFMDGIDGITGTETIAIATGCCLVMSGAGFGDSYVDLLTLVLTGSALGFLAFNWHPAKIFLGDVGSVPLGYLTGFCLLTLATHGYLIPALILPLYYLADSGITIGKRTLRGEKIWQAHRQHYYQRAAKGVGRHDLVVIWIAAADAALIALALLAVSAPWVGFPLALLVVALLLWKLHKSMHANAQT